MSAQRTYFVSAGEYSGDLLAADVVIALRQLQPEIRAHGVVGPAMLQAGVESMFGIERLSTMGISDVLKRLGDFKILDSLLLEMIDRVKPEFAILVDFPAFHIRLAEQLKLRGIPVVQYVAPKLWAWGKKRVSAMREHFDLVLGILPFEEAFYRSNGINYRYVGCPHVDRTAKISVRKEDLGFKSADRLLAMLPGSRIEELTHILPALVEIRKRMQADAESVQFVIPVAPNIGIQHFVEIAKSLGFRVSGESDGARHEKATDSEGVIDIEGIRLVNGMSIEILSIAEAAIIASGTATLEAALMGVPMVVIYRMSAASFQFAKEVVRLDHISLVNLIADKMVVPEFIQNIDTNEVAKIASELLSETSRRKEQMRAFDEIRDSLKGNAAKVAATEILQSIVN